MRAFYKLYEVLGCEDAQTNMNISQAEIKANYHKRGRDGKGKR